MPPSGASRDSTRFVALFQKAHGHVAALQRLDDQIAALFDQRRRAIEDLRAVQTQINNEFQRVLELDRVVPADMLSQMEEAASIEGAKPVQEARETRAAVETRPAPREVKTIPIAVPRLPVLETAGS
jgi:hypothetical protein